MRIPLKIIVLGLAISLVVAEVAVYILIGQAIGVLATLTLSLLLTLTGAALLRQQGLATAMRVRADIGANRLPGLPLIDGACLAVAALLMILPGFITSGVGLLLFIPALRRALGRKIADRIAGRVAIRMARRPDAPPRPQRTVELEPRDYSAAPRRDTPWRGD